MPASRATASIETAWKPRSRDDRLGGVEQLLAPLPGLHARWPSALCYTSVGYGYVTRHGQLRRRHRDHRQRLLRPRHGDPPQAGGDRGLHRAGARRRRRRHVALQHLPGLRLRRAVAPLLVLVRAQPGVERDLLAPARDPRLPARASPTSYGVREKVRLNCDGRGHRVDEDGGWTIDTSDGPLRARVSWSPAWARWPSRRSRTSQGLDDFEGAIVPLRPLGPRLRPHAASASPPSAPAPRRSSSCRRSRSRSRRCTSSSAPRRGSCRTRTAPIRGWEQRLYDRVPAAAEARARRRSTRGASCSCSASSSTRG